MIKTSLTRNVAAFEEYIVTEKEAVIAAGFCIAIRWVLETEYNNNTDREFSLILKAVHQTVSSVI